ncbi:C40 family peptidase [Pedobacter ureilyticus]|uniref:Peptidoglycan-binding protein n=1 Tax=Pedobacter ureilyticus TaxID=1393051 RepID=A0ABW9JES3_9SPHI|nr:peptidoglycan-binding protein [Pedobacter helvus]
MGTIFNLFGLLCIIALLGHWHTDRDLLGGKITNLRITNLRITNKQITNQPITNQQTNQITKSPDLQIANQPNTQKNKQLLEIAKSQIGVREASGNNDGYEVETYLAYTGNKKGEPWCASFVSWVFGKAGYTAPRTAWSPSLFPKARLVAAGKPAMVFGIYFPDKGRIAHAEIVEKQKDNWLCTIEGNTNIEGSREGDGVYRKMRHIKTIKYYADWINMEGGRK